MSRGNVLYFSILLATFFHKYWNVGTEPVKFIPAKFGSSQIASPNVGPSAGKNEMTPGGSPASSSAS